VEHASDARNVFGDEQSVAVVYDNCLAPRTQDGYTHPDGAVRPAQNHSAGEHLDVLKIIPVSHVPKEYAPTVKGVLTS
jgi:hypothetical protein